MADKTLISVCIFTYNAACFVGKTIESILDQSFDSYELIIVDDGSTDNSSEIIKGYDNSKLRYVRKEHSGRPKSRNRCIEEAQGEYILWLGADDILMPGCLKGYAAAINDFPDTDIFYSNILKTDEFLNPQKVIEYSCWAGKSLELQSAMPFRNEIPDTGSICRKSLYEQYGNYNESFVRAQDYEWFLRVVPHVKVRHTGLVSCKWRRTAVSSGETPQGFAYGAMAIQQFLEKHSVEELAQNAGLNMPVELAVMVYQIRLAERLLNLGAPELALCHAKQVIAQNAPDQIRSVAKQLLGIALERVEQARMRR
jgi:cellulose synthase/poly-beta-1,6-N-acetylglucosamine synthase-like glycosyltransferase